MQVFNSKCFPDAKYIFLLKYLIRTKVIWTLISTRSRGRGKVAMPLERIQIKVEITFVLIDPFQ